MGFSPFSKEHIEELMEKELEKLDMDYTPDDSYWVLENTNKDRAMHTDSWLKAVWFEELVSEGIVDGRVTIMRYDAE